MKSKTINKNLIDVTPIIFIHNSTFYFYYNFNSAVFNINSSLISSNTDYLGLFIIMYMNTKTIAAILILAGALSVFFTKVHKPETPVSEFAAWKSKFNVKF